MQYNIAGEGTEQSGLSDAVVSAFFSPKDLEKLTWGVGPAFLVPTGTNDALTTKLRNGSHRNPFEAKKRLDHWGFIQIWSVAGFEERPDVSQIFFQPFLVYNCKSGNFQLSSITKNILLRTILNKGNSGLHRNQELGNQQKKF